MSVGMSGAPVTIRARIDELIKQHGGLRAAARALKINPSYLSRLRNGHLKNPSDLVLRRMGLTQTTIYTRSA